MKRLVIGFGCATLACAAEVATIAVPQGVTNTLSQAISNGCLSGVEGRDGLLAAEDLQVTGGGLLEIDEDLKSAGFAGEIHVRAGATLLLTVKGALGDTAHGTFVEDGATLQTFTASTAQNALDFQNEPLSFAGTGVTGQGALMALSLAANQRNGVWGGTSLTMTGDASISMAGQYQDFPANVSSANQRQLNMNGHTLTIIGAGAGKILPIRPVVTNPGHIVLTNVQCSINGVAKLGGTSANTFTIGAGSSLELFSHATAGLKPWTLIVKSTVDQPISTSQVGGVWDGPIVMQGNYAIGASCATSGTSVMTNQTTFYGPFDSDERVRFQLGYTKNPTGTIYLASSENRFGGGVSVKDVNFGMAVDGAIPLDTPSFTMTNSCLKLGEGVWHLPSMTYHHNADTVTSADAVDFAGTFTKAGTGVFRVGLKPSFDTLDLKAGGVGAQRNTDLHWNAGLWEGTNQAYDAWSSGEHPGNSPKDGFYSRVCWTNQVTLGTDLAMTTTNFNGKCTMITYKGYIWNRTGTSARVTFASSVETISQMYVGTQNVGKQGQNEFLVKSITLAPGAHAFEFRIAATSGWVKPNGKFSSQYGLMYRWGEASDDPADYLPAIDPGDGSLFTLTLPGTAEYAAREAAALAVSKLANRVVAAPGTSLHLGGGRYAVGDVEGPLNVVAENNALRSDALLRVEGTVTCTAADLLAGRCLTTDAPLVFADGAALEVENLANLAIGQSFVAVRATTAITGCPSSTVPALRVSVPSANPNTVVIEHLPVGTLMLFR